MSICIRSRIFRKTRHFAPRALTLAAFLTLGGVSSGCVYRMAVQQGNFLDPAQVQQLQTGMTRAQVRFLLGTPMLPDAFEHNRWDYIYYLKLGRIQQPTERRLTVWFEGDKVARFENVGIELPKADAAGAPAPAAVPAPTTTSTAPASPAPAAGQSAATTR